MPDETTSADTPSPALVEPVAAEPTVVSDPEPVAVVEPVIVAISTESVVETVEEPSIVSEAQVAPEPEPPVSAPTELRVEVPASVSTEPTQTPEQPVETPQPSVSAPVGDLGLTPQMAPSEALKLEVPPVIPAEVLQPEPARVSVFETASPVEPIKMISSFIRKLLPEANFAIQSRKRKKLDRIMGLFAKQASITNDDAEKLLHISDATASRYLGILEKEGKVKQVGTAGRWVSYVKA